MLERLLYDLMHFTETGKHLDVENYTLCTGSRRADNKVPYVGWDPDPDDGREVCVHWCPPAYSGAGLRAREVVS